MKDNSICWGANAEQWKEKHMNKAKASSVSAVNLYSSTTTPNPLPQHPHSEFGSSKRREREEWDSRMKKNESYVCKFTGGR